MRFLVYVLVLIAVLIAVPVPSNLTVAQDVPLDLDWCQRNCDWLIGGGSSSNYLNYSACTENCNRQFWKYFGRETEETERAR